MAQTYILNYILYDKYMNVVKQGIRLARAFYYEQARDSIEHELVYQYPDIAWVKVK